MGFRRAVLGIYLTNTLADAPSQQQPLAFAQFIAAESQAANEVKQTKPVMVVLGNPPYSGHSANKGEWIAELVEDYKKGIPELYKPAQAKWLQDDYVKFIRFGQWRINRTGEGILAFISNNGYLDNPTFRGMRQSLLREFNSIYVLNLHGSSKKKERTPTGEPDENVFDIQQGVAIALFIKQASISNAQATVYYADMWGERESKYGALVEQDVSNTAWQRLAPAPPLYLFVPQDADVRTEYELGWKLSEMMGENGDPAPGIVTTHDEFAISWSADDARGKVRRLLSTNSEEEARGIWRLCSQSQWNYTRAKAALATGEWEDKVFPLLYRPFDVRWTVFDSNVAVHRRERVMLHMLAGDNLGVATTRSVEIGRGFEHVFCTRNLIQHHSVSLKEVNYLFPLYLYPVAEGSTGRNRQVSMLENEAGTGPGGRRPNLNPDFIADLEQRLGLHFVSDGKGDLQQTFGPEDVFHYAYAVFHSPTYRERYAEFLKIDFPRLPLTSDRALFAALAAKGAELVDLHLLRLPGSGGVGGAGGSAVLVSPGKQGLSFPKTGSNRVDKVRYVGAQGEQLERVYINDEQYFEGIEAGTWEMHIGGYQPLDKWLKDRKGRTLSFDDVQHYLRMAIALRETRRIMGDIDALIPEWPVQ